MKSYIFIWAILLAATSASLADEVSYNGTPVTLTKVNDDDFGSQGRPRTPANSPLVFISGHMLYLYEGCFNTAIDIVDESGLVVYSTFVAEGTEFLYLPAALSGTYTLRIARDNIIYVGKIEL